MIPASILTTNGDMLSRMPPGTTTVPPSPERQEPPAPHSALVEELQAEIAALREKVQYLEVQLGKKWLSSSASDSSLHSTAASGGRSTPTSVPDHPRPPLAPDEMLGAALEAIGSRRTSRSSSATASSLRQTQTQLQPPEHAPETCPEVVVATSDDLMFGYRVVAPFVADIRDSSQIGLSPGEELRWCMHTTWPGWLYIQKHFTGEMGYVPEECLQEPEATDDVMYHC